MMVFKNILIILFMLTFVFAISWLIVETAKPEVLPVGSLMPEMKYRDPAGHHCLESDTLRTTMVILFHRKCGHCIYQMSLLNDHVDKIKKVRIVLLTFDKNFFEKEKLQPWQRLYQAQNVQWGIVESRYFKQCYGMTSTPSFFIFNKKGELVQKIRGEVKFQIIIDALRNLDIPECSNQ